MSAPATSPVVSPFSGQALLVSGDPEAIRQITGALQKFALSLQICPDLESAAHFLSTRKFNAIVVDLAFDQQLSKLLALMRSTPSNQNAITFAIVDSRTRSESQIAPNFVMQKPLASALVASTLKAALGSIILNYRRYFRYPIKVPASITVAGSPTASCELMNISEGGVALNLCPRLELGVRVVARFKLPDMADEFNVEAIVSWSDGKCRAGLQFCELPIDERTQLQTWLSKKIEDSFPASLMRLYQKKQ